MKKVTLTFFFALLAITGFAQDARKDQRIVEDATDAKVAFLDDDPSMQELFDSSYGYLILPNVGKGGFGIGGAAGNGVAYQGGSQVGFAKMTQVTIGFQAG